MELNTTTLKRRRPKFPKNPDDFLSDFLFIAGNDTLSEIVEFRANMSFIGSTNVESFDVYINGDFFGTDVQEIQITTNDILRIDVVKTNNSLESNIKFESTLV
jgi:predicted RNA-binding protein